MRPARASLLLRIGSNDPATMMSAPGPKGRLWTYQATVNAQMGAEFVEVLVPST
jgi:hypothetical protein